MRAEHCEIIIMYFTLMKILEKKFFLPAHRIFHATEGKKDEEMGVVQVVFITFTAGIWWFIFIWSNSARDLNGLPAAQWNNGNEQQNEYHRMGIPAAKP